MTARAALAFGMALAAWASLARAGDAEKPAPVKTEHRYAEGAVVRSYRDEQLLELKVERVLPDENTAGKASGDAPRPDDKAAADEAPPPIFVGEIVFLHVVDARVTDEKGAELQREDKLAWLSRDLGWAALKPGKRIKVDVDKAYLIPAPRDFPEDARAGGDLLAYHVIRLFLLEPKRSGP